jgi:hypothetical protein
MFTLFCSRFAKISKNYLWIDGALRRSRSSFTFDEPTERIQNSKIYDSDEEQADADILKETLPPSMVYDPREH